MRNVTYIAIICFVGVLVGLIGGLAAGFSLYPAFLCGPRVCLATTAIQNVSAHYYLTARLLQCSDPADRDGSQLGGRVDELLLAVFADPVAATVFQATLSDSLTIWSGTAEPLVPPAANAHCEARALTVSVTTAVFVGLVAAALGILLAWGALRVLQRVGCANAGEARKDDEKTLVGLAS